MKKTLLIIALLALPAGVFAKIDPTRPMVTGRGNVDARPQRVIVANQTPAETDADVVKLEKFVVTGSLIHKAKHPKSAARR